MSGFSLLTYVWLDNQGEFSTNSLVMKGVEITHVRDVKTRALDFIIERDGKKGTQSVVLHPIKLYINCFKPQKNSFLVLCNAQYSNEDFDRKIYAKEMPLIARQQFYLTNDVGQLLNDENVNKNDYKKSIYEVMYKSGNKSNKFDNFCLNLERHLLISGIRLLELNGTILSQVEVSICENSMSLCDDILITRYISKKLANTMNLRAIFNNNLEHRTELSKLRCVFEFYTKEMAAKETGLKTIEKVIEKIKENNDDYNDSCLVEGQEKIIFKKSVGHFDCSIRIPIQTYSNKGGSINDLRALSNCNPYRAVNNLLKSLGFESKEFYTLDDGLKEVQNILSDQETEMIYMKPYINDIKFKIKEKADKILKSTGADDFKSVRDKLEETTKSYNPKIIELLKQKKTGEMYDLVNKLLGEMEDAVVTTDINIDD